MPTRHASQRPIRARLIFNTLSGQLEESPQQLADIIITMQENHILPEVYMIRQDSDVSAVVRSAIKSGIGLIVVAGGDGTIESVAGSMIGGPATLGIVPTGTRNNIAFNLGIPSDIPGAVALLRSGTPAKIDVGQVRCGRTKHWFLEAASLGLISDLYPFADSLQHGDITQIGNLLAAFVASMPSRLSLSLDGRKVEGTTLIALIANMSYIGPHFQISPRVSPIDGKLDVFLLANIDKIEMLITYANRAADSSLKDPNITHYRAREISITSEPPMPILADNFRAGEGRATIRLEPAALTVLTGPGMIGGRKRARRA